MELGKGNMKKIKGLILFAGIVVLVLIKFDMLVSALKLFLQMLSPFIVGGAMAFILNLPMRFYEKKLFRKQYADQSKQKKYEKRKRPVCLTLALLSVILVIAVVTGTVIPQLISTGKVLAQEIPVFWDNLMTSAERFFTDNAELEKQLKSLEIPDINWDSMLQATGNFLKNGMGSLASTTFSVAGSIVSGAVNFFIALIFSLYIL